ncbi:hypothetical protein GGI23_005502, partial [Coemansia sp. RSA 2559]
MTYICGFISLKATSRSRASVILILLPSVDLAARAHSAASWWLYGSDVERLRASRALGPRGGEGKSIADDERDVG